MGEGKGALISEDTAGEGSGSSIWSKTGKYPSLAVLEGRLEECSLPREPPGDIRLIRLWTGDRAIWHYTHIHTHVLLTMGELICV